MSTKDHRMGEFKNALWSDVKHVLLDMDGTLFDKYFDDYFWEHLVPEKYSEKHNITFGRAKEELLERYRAHEGTLNWTDIDFWTGELDLDIPALKEQIRHLIEIHPHVEDFLKAIKKAGKMVFLVTNAHYKTLEIKLRKTQIGGYFDGVFSSFDMGAPKEVISFWERAEEAICFEKERTLFVDDTEAVLRTARDYGIRYILLKKRANSKEKPDKAGSGLFLSITDFRELL